MQFVLLGRQIPYDPLMAKGRCDTNLASGSNQKSDVFRRLDLDYGQFTITAGPMMSNRMNGGTQLWIRKTGKIRNSAPYRWKEEEDEHNF